MKNRVVGKSTRSPELYIGKPVVSREAFYCWARPSAVLLNLYKNWEESGFDTRLAPSINRIFSSKGYTFDNMEWVTASENSKLAQVGRIYYGKKSKAQNTSV